MRERVLEFDRTGDLLFDKLRGRSWADRLFYGASALGDMGLIWLMLATFRALRGDDYDEKVAMRAMIALGLESILVNAGVKSLFRRRRPLHEAHRPLPLRIPITSSFPSGHATAAFCAATLLAEGDALAPLYFAAAAVVAASRVHVKIHHPSDVVGGVVIGLALGHIARVVAPIHGGPR